MGGPNGLAGPSGDGLSWTDTSDRRNAMTTQVFTPAPKQFDPLTASRVDLARHGLPQRPDQPGPAALWEKRARRYRGFEHLRPELIPGEATGGATGGATGKTTGTAPAGAPGATPAAGLLPALVTAGFELTSEAPITIFSGNWTVPDLNHAPSDFPNHFHTFFGLGFLDVHVEMTVDAAQNVTSLIRIHTGAQVAMSVRPGDLISATLCLQTDAAGTASYFLANETTEQATNFTIATGFPPAHGINAGITRDSTFNGPPDPLAKFGVVYFDELSAFATAGQPRLPNGGATTMVDLNGTTLARPEKLTDFTFRILPA
jgi:Peptidase A4 family